MNTIKDRRSIKFDEEFEKSYEDFWKPLITTEGYIDEQKVKNELHDLVFCHNQISEVYCELTGGQLSYANYYADDIITAIEDRTYDKNTTQEDVKMYINSCNTLQELKEDLTNYFELGEL